MDVVCDLEANGLTPDQIWVIVCKDIETEKNYVFHPYRNEDEKSAFRRFAENVNLWVGHNFISYDRRALASVLGVVIDPIRVCDTLVVSRTIDATRSGPRPHSLEAWGNELGRPKKHTDIEDWSDFTEEMEERCKGDVETNFLLYKHFRKYITSPKWASALETERYIATLCVDDLQTNGLPLDYSKALELKERIDKELIVLLSILKEVFPIRVSLDRLILPKETKHGTINRTTIPRCLGNDLTPYTAGAPFSLIKYTTFDPGSPKQRIDRLWEAGWQPTNRTKGHKQAARDLRSLERKRKKTRDDEAAIAALEVRLAKFARYGWTTDDENLDTIPQDAPEGIRKLARWLKLNSRSNVLGQWIAAARPSYDEYGAIQEYRVHGTFNHIQPWTHRMSHTNPNLGNVPKFNEKRPETTPYSDEMRRLWQVRRDRLLVGVDAESIQLRIFGHYINDPTFIEACISGNKENGTDPHSVNQRALGTPCKSRDDAKTFIYAWLLGAGIEQVAFILGCSREEAQEANENFLDNYPGLRYIKEEVIPVDAERGYFQGFDGRFVRIRGDDVNSRRHFCLGGYLQNGEAVIMKRAVQIWHPKLKRERVPFWWVNFVHDEFQTETINDIEVAKYVATTQADAIRQVGIDLGLRCPMAGSVLNAHGKLAIGSNWMDTH